MVTREAMPKAKKSTRKQVQLIFFQTYHSNNIQYSIYYNTTIQYLIKIREIKSTVEGGLTDFVSDPEDSAGAPRREIGSWVPPTVTSDHMVHLGSNPFAFKAHRDDHNQSNSHNILQPSHYYDHKTQNSLGFSLSISFKMANQKIKREVEYRQSKRVSFSFQFVAHQSLVQPFQAASFPKPT